MLNIDKSRVSRRILIYILTIFFLIVLVFPIITLFIKAFYNEGIFVGVDNFKKYFTTPALSESLANSITVSTITSLITILVAFIFAYGIERSKIRFKKALNFIALLPLFIPTMTHAISLIYLFGENGIFTTGFFGMLPKLAFHFPLYGKWGVILAECIYIFPAIYMMFSIAFKVCDYRLYEAAKILGTKKIRIFTTITLPELKYTIISAFFAAFTMVFSDFGIPKVLGGNYNLLSTEIYKQVIGQSNITMGATVGILLIIPSIISFIVDKKINNSVSTIDSGAKKFEINENKKRDILIGIITYSVSIFIIIIFLSVIIAAFVEQWPYNMRFTFKWFKVNSIGITPLNIFINTIFVSILSSILGVIVAILTAYITERGVVFRKVRKLLDWLSILPLAIPGMVIGLAYLLFFNEVNNPLKIIYGTFIIMIFANTIHFLSMPYMTIKGEMKKIDSEYENVSETMSIPWYCVFDSVILPLSKNAIIESFQYYFLNSMVTISALIFLYTTKTNVASVEMISTYDEGYIASTAAIAVMILVINLIVKYAIEFYKKRSNGGERERKMKIYRTLYIINENENLSQRKLANEVGVSLGKMNSIIRKSIKDGLIKKIKEGKNVQYHITDKGFSILQENIESIKNEMILISKDSDKKIDSAVILAAGKKKDFDVTPAALSIGESTVIEETVRKLKENNVENIYVVVGFNDGRVRELLESYEGITFIKSNNYENSGSMDSLALVKDYIQDDFILVEGDVVFQSKALTFLLESNKREGILITEVSKSGDEEFVQSKQGYLFKLGKDVHQFNRVDGELIGISKISYKLYDLMMKEYKENMNSLLNYEYILLDVSRDFKVPCITIENIIWGEIDNKEQYDEVKKFIILNKI